MKVAIATSWLAVLILGTVGIFYYFGTINSTLSPTNSPAPTQNVSLYYYDSNKDKDADGNILCSSQGLVAVQRQIPVSITPIQDTIRLLLKGELTSAEREQGVTTEYPLPGFELVGASQVDGALTLTFNDSQAKTTGGSCRVSILWNQIAATAKQFPSVTSVKFSPDTLFQP
jgi:spore germination protein GerM